VDLTRIPKAGNVLERIVGAATRYGLEETISDNM
jgi:hypothetical protein